MNQNEEIRVLYVQPGKYPEEIKIPNTLETFQSANFFLLKRSFYDFLTLRRPFIPLFPTPFQRSCLFPFAFVTDLYVHIA